jgi:PilZ domain
MAAKTGLQFLLVSNNYHTLTAVADGLQQIGAGFDFVPTIEAGRDYIERRHLDGIIVDLDVSGAQDLILFVRQGTSNRSAVVFACLPSGNQSPVAIVTGATVLLPRPVTSESIACNVLAARSSMVQQRRRFFRCPLSLPVRLTSNGAEQRAIMTNLSEGGMAVYVVKPVEHAGMIEFVFQLPSGDSIAGKGSIAWANHDGMLGIKFQFLRARGEEILQKWLREWQCGISEDSSISDSENEAPHPK